MKILLSTGLEVSIASIAILVLVVLLFYLGRSAFRGFKSMSQEKYLVFDGVLPYKLFNRMLKDQIDNADLKSTFTVLYISIDKINNLENSINLNVMRKILESLLIRIKQHYNYEATIGSYHKGVFLVYLNEEYQYTEAMNLTYELMNKMREPYLISQKTELFVNVSIAIAFYPLHGNNANVIIKKLEEVADDIEKDGGNSVRSCGSSDVFSSEYLDYYHQIKQGIAKNEFEFHYQPVINTSNDNIEALAAFIRWNHPELGVLEAAKFIHILEQSGDIYWVSIHGLEMACKNYELLSSLVKNDNLQIYLIIGNQELGNINLLKDFKRIIKKYKMDPSKIVLEVRESVLLASGEDPMRIAVKKLKEFGFKIKSDVYGISNQELNNLTNDKIDIFKLSPSFTQDHDEASLSSLNKVVKFAKDNNIKLTATQVEDEEKLNIYQTAGVEKMQGHYFQKPLSFTDLEEWCDSRIVSEKEEPKEELTSSDELDEIKDEKRTRKPYDSKKDSKQSKKEKDQNNSEEIPKNQDQDLESGESVLSKASEVDLDEKSEKPKKKISSSNE